MKHSGLNSNTYGILCGLLMSCWVLIEYVLGFHTTSLDIGQYSGYFAVLIPLIIIFIALSERQKSLNRPIQFVDGINVGFKIAILSSLVLTIFFYIYNTYINPDWIDRMIDWQRKQMIINGSSPDEIQAFVNRNAVHYNALGQSIMGFISWTGIGVFITLLEIPLVKKFFKSRYLA